MALARTSETSAQGSGTLKYWTMGLVLFLATYSWTFYDLIQGWLRKDATAFGVLILGAGGFLLWERRKEITGARIKPNPLGWVILGVSIVPYLVGTRAAAVFPGGMTAVFVRSLSLVGMVGGAGLILFGTEMMRPVWLPALLILFAVPENFLTASWMQVRLQRLATTLSYIVASAGGMEVIRQGNELRTGVFTANVAEACSGIRSLMAILPASMYLAGTGLRNGGPKVAFVALAVPVAIAANSFRITATLVLGTYVSPEMADGFFHHFAGLGVFVLALGCMFLLLKMLRTVEQDPAVPDGEDADGGAPDRQGGFLERLGRRCHSRQFLALCGVFGILAVLQGAQMYSYASQPDGRKYPDAPLESVPALIGRWQGEEQEFDEEVWRVREPTDAVTYSYRKSGMLPVRGTVLYWKPGADPERKHLRHSIERCGPAHGMEEQWMEKMEVSTGSDLAPEVTVRVAGYTGDGRSMIVTSCEMAGLTELDMSARRNERGYTGLLVYGLRSLWVGPARLKPSISFQLSTGGDHPREEVIAAHRDVAGRFIGRTLEEIYSDQK